MAENLKTTRYNNGETIPLVVDSTAWSNLVTPGYCCYNNDSTTYKKKYGALYNWYTVNTGKLAPTGWHVPTDAEWSTLSSYLGGESVAGGKLKEAGSGLWCPENIGATNETGFTGLPGGYRDSDGVYNWVGSNGKWWSSTSRDTAYSWCRCMGCGIEEVVRDSSANNYGFSVRCVRD